MRQSSRPHSAGPIAGPIAAVFLLVASVAGCGLLDAGGEEGSRSTTAEVNCAEQCPCDCACPDPTADVPDGNEPYPMVFAGNVKVTEGKLPETAAKKKISSERIALRECYAPALKKNPELKGELDVQFTVSGSTGKIIAALPRQSTLENKEVEQCIVKKVKGWTFPKTDDGKESVVRFTTVMLAVSL